MSDRIPDDTAVRTAQCASCVMKPVSQGGIDLAPGRRVEIQEQALHGVNQLCHHDGDRTVCRGVRDFQLTLWHRMGLLDAPTDEALERAMVEHGIVPRRHVANRR